jgi:GH15 family glucan-1,4-alpha-glucosidase
VTPARGPAGTIAPPSAPPSIADYALLSNCRLCALVSRAGSIDWLCLPEPHSPAIFARILDPERGGCWSVLPRRLRSIDRRYLDGTCVLETIFTTDTGRARITDALQLSLPDRRPGTLLPDQELVRKIECIEGTVDIDTAVTPRPNFARSSARTRRLGQVGIWVEAGPQSFLLRADFPLHQEDDPPLVAASLTLHAGQTRWMALGHTAGGPPVAPMIGAPAADRLDGTIDWWRRWADARTLPRTRPDAALRSALTLKSLAYSPTGAILAAPTTSLPEDIGGERNWDYRYCWIRDASFVMRAFLNIEARDETDAFFSWLMYASRLAHPSLHVLYDVHGRDGPPERELEHLAGYRESKPVRVGNGARDQLQLDTYGALLDAAWRYHQSQGIFQAAQGRMLRGFARTASKSWRKPDAGIWEIRAGPRHHTLSKAMCWVAVDRAVRLAREGVMSIDADAWTREADRIRDTVAREGYNESLRSYTATLGGDDVDASLLLLSIYGFEPADSPRMNGTIDRIFERLGDGGALRRYRDTNDGLAGEEGRFGICGFWAVEALARAGRETEARAIFDDLVARGNDVGLFAEEFEERSGGVLGNFPQALTHLGLINAACALDRGKAVQPDEPSGPESQSP